MYANNARKGETMDVKEAVAAAKKYVGELFAQEGISNLGLEEVEFDDEAKEWRVTVGFSRPWDSVSTLFATVQQLSNPRRAYKIVRISDSTGAALSVKNRDEVS
jgi:hypothetical protein